MTEEDEEMVNFIAEIKILADNCREAYIKAQAEYFSIFTSVDKNHRRYAEIEKLNEIARLIAYDGEIHPNDKLILWQMIYRVRLYLLNNGEQLNESKTCH